MNLYWLLDTFILFDIEHEMRIIESKLFYDIFIFTFLWFLMDPFYV